MTGKLSTAVAALVLALLASASSALAGGGAGAGAIAVKALNAQRTTNGIPSVVENSQGSAGCAAHNSYMQRNNFFGHGEDPSKPGYSTLGDIYQQPFGEVLSSGGGDFQSWAETGYGPWESAPIHLFLILSPRVASIGADESHGYDCMRPDHSGSVSGFYSYPGPNTTGAVFSEHAAEWPYIPQEKVGIPADQTTGPNILLFGPCQLQSAAIGGPGGAVNSRLATSKEVEFFYGGGDLIPVKPLLAFTTYTVTANWSCGQQSFSFTTGGKENEVDLQVADGERGDGKVVLQVSSSAPAGTATISGPAGTITVQLVRANGELETKPLALAPGHYKACATTGDKTNGYRTATACKEFDHRGATSGLLAVGKAVHHGGRISFTVRASGPLVGQKIAVHTTLSYRCGGKWCNGWVKQYRSTVVLKRTQTFSFPAPGHEMVSNSDFFVTGFTSGGVTYGDAEVIRSVSGH